MILHLGRKDEPSSYSISVRRTEPDPVDTRIPASLISVIVPAFAVFSLSNEAPFISTFFPRKKLNADGYGLFKALTS